jgi:parvulin-like peptidyl-prolyl isomerase
VRSAYGLHLVRIGARRDGRAPPLAEVRALVEREWKAERRQEVRRQRLAELAEYYDIVIETQGGGAAGSDP